MPHWFGVADANEQYRGVADRSPTLVAYDNAQPVGFLTLVTRNTSDLANTGVRLLNPFE